MKKLFVVILMLMPFVVSSSVLAQKKYVTVYRSGTSDTQISGDIPSDMNYSTNKGPMGVVNELAARGYEVESVSFAVDEKRTYVLYLLSKRSSGSSNAIATVRADDDSDVYEVARYNLQGMTIPPTEKGIQIIVYSNYTTKTIIVE